jgi:hypothetical protein
MSAPYEPGENADFKPALSGDELVAHVNNWAAENEAQATALGTLIQSKIAQGADWGEILQLIMGAVGIAAVLVPK